MPDDRQHEDEGREQPEHEERASDRAGRTDEPEHDPTDADRMGEGREDYGEDVGMDAADEGVGEGGRRTDEAGTPTGDRERDPDRPLDEAPGRDETQD